jgi:phage terminase large subunit-like protein
VSSRATVPISVWLARHRTAPIPITRMAARAHFDRTPLPYQRARRRPPRPAAASAISRLPAYLNCIEVFRARMAPAPSLSWGKNGRGFSRGVSWGLAMRADLGGGSSSLASIADLIERDWQAIARPEQLPPPGDWSVWLYLAGRGAGKTRSGAEAIKDWITSGQCGRVALIAPTAGDARDVMIEGESGLMAISSNSNRPNFEPSKRRLTWPNGAIATLYSAEESDRLRGPQHDGLWADELAAWKGAQSVWDMAMLGLRLGRNPRAIVTTTPRPIPLLKALLKRSGQDVTVTRGSTFDNRANLAPTFLTQIVGRYQGTRLGRQELMAELLEDVQGALWSRDLLESNRRVNVDVPPLKRVVVAIDPAVSVSEASDETGIIVAGLGTDDRGYLLEDCSGKFSPIDWAREAIRLYRKWGADRIVAEINQGGLMVEQTVRTVDQNVSFKAVHAHRGKLVRAEPVAALSEQHRILHVGAFVELEDQLCTFSPGSSDSPDRLDAYVIGFTEMMVDTANGTPGFITFYEELVREQEAAALAPASEDAPGEI